MTIAAAGVQYHLLAVTATPLILKSFGKSNSLISAFSCLGKAEDKAFSIVLLLYPSNPFNPSLASLCSRLLAYCLDRYLFCLCLELSLPEAAKVRLSSRGKTVVLISSLYNSVKAVSPLSKVGCNRKVWSCAILSQNRCFPLVSFTRKKSVASNNK